MTLTTLTALVVLGLQGGGSAPNPQQPPAAHQETARIKVLEGSAVKIAEQLKAAPISEVSFLSADAKENVVIARGTAKGLKSLRELIDRMQQPRVLRRYRVLNSAAQAVYGVIAKKPIPGIDFLSYDPTDNSLVARGTEKAHQELLDRIQDLDRIRP
jgi:hypothetical protein